LNQIQNTLTTLNKTGDANLDVYFTASTSYNGTLASALNNIIYHSPLSGAAYDETKTPSIEVPSLWADYVSD